MRLQALLAESHGDLAGQALAAPSGTAGPYAASFLEAPGPLPSGRPLGVRPRPAAFLHDRWDALAQPGLQGMELSNWKLPDRGSMEELRNACKLQAVRKFVDAADDGTNFPAKDLGTGIAKASGCAQAVGTQVMERFFGRALDASKDGVDDTQAAGVTLVNTAAFPLGSIGRNHLEAAQDACHDFGAMLLHRLGPREGTSAPKAARQAALSAADAAHSLRAFGRCLDSLGEAAAAKGCELGDLHTAGGDSAAFCEEIQGPKGYHWACAVM